MDYSRAMDYTKAIDTIDLKAVLFDLDDTMLDRMKTFSLYCDYLINEVFPQNLSDAQKSEAKEFMVLNDRHGYEDRETLYQKVIRKWGLSCGTKYLIDGWYNNLDKLAAPENGLFDILEYLAMKYKLGLVTNGLISVQNSKISALGIKDYFQAIIISEAVGVNKPNNGIFLLACKKLGVEAAQSVFIGDSFENDVHGAVQAGLSAIWMDKSNSDKEYPYKIRSLMELKEIL